MTQRLRSALLFSFKPAPRSWKGLLPPLSPPLPDTFASSTAINVAPCPHSPHLTRALLLRTQSVLYNARPSKCHRCSLILRVALTTSMPTSSAPPCAPKGVDHYLISWVRSFLTGRSCRLLFQGSGRIFSPVSVGTPQGSLVSPLLFVIYVAPLHIPLSWGLVLFYVPDFSLTVSSPSYRNNSRSLQAAFGPMRAMAHSREVAFSVPKAELIHGRTLLQWDPPGALRPPTVALDGQYLILQGNFVG